MKKIENKIKNLKNYNSAKNENYKKWPAEKNRKINKKD